MRNYMSSLLALSIQYHINTLNSSSSHQPHEPAANPSAAKHKSSPRPPAPHLRIDTHWLPHEWACTQLLPGRMLENMALYSLQHNFKTENFKGGCYMAQPWHIDSLTSELHLREHASLDRIAREAQYQHALLEHMKTRRREALSYADGVVQAVHTYDDIDVYIANIQ